MTGRRRRSDRSGRAPLFSPGRPVVAGRDQQQRIWAAHGLQPHRVRTFKLSSDPKFAAKVQDVIGLYINPPEACPGAVSR